MLKEVEYEELVENDYNPRKRFNDAETVSYTHLTLPTILLV